MTGTARIGVVLSAGGVRGVYAHTGFLQAIEQMHMPVSAVAGCSAGAIVGGVYASGTPLQQWVEALNRLEQENFWQPGSWPRMLSELLVRRGRRFIGVSGTDAAIAFCQQQVTSRTFGDCPIPFHALATSLSSGEKVLFSDGELSPRIVASASIPLLYQPVEIDGEFYCDGGVIDLAPTNAICCRHELDVLIVHHVATRNRGFHGMRPSNRNDWPILEILDALLFRTRPWYLSDHPLTFRRCPCGCKALIVVVEPVLAELPWPQTERGPDIQASAANQFAELLAPHLDSILHHPQALLDQVLPPDASSAKGGVPC